MPRIKLKSFLYSIAALIFTVTLVPSVALDVITTEIRELQEGAGAMLTPGKMHEQLLHYETLSDWVGRGSIVISLALLVAIFWLLRKGLIQPLQVLLQDITRYREGDRSTRLDAEAIRFRELYDAALSFNSLTEHLNQFEQQRTNYLLGIAHDLRNPLTVIRGTTQYLLSHKSSLDPEAFSKRLTLVNTQTERIEQVLADAIEREQIEHGALTLDLNRCDICQIAESTVANWQGASSIHTLELKRPAHAVIVNCDPERIRQVITNLLSNAIKFSPSGGKIVCQVRESDPWAEIAVSDPGLGIAEADLKRLFEPFHRSPTIRDTIPGAGLGLSVSKKIVSAHGGQIQVASRLGRGSVFTVRLPSAEAQLRAA